MVLLDSGFLKNLEGFCRWPCNFSSNSLINSASFYRINLRCLPTHLQCPLPLSQSLFNMFHGISWANFPLAWFSPVWGPPHNITVFCALSRVVHFSVSDSGDFVDSLCEAKRSRSWKTYWGLNLMRCGVFWSFSKRCQRMLNAFDLFWELIFSVSFIQFHCILWRSHFGSLNSSIRRASCPLHAAKRMLNGCMHPIFRRPWPMESSCKSPR